MRVLFLLFIIFYALACSSIQEGIEEQTGAKKAKQEAKEKEDALIKEKEKNDELNKRLEEIEKKQKEEQEKREKEEARQLEEQKRAEEEKKRKEQEELARAHEEAMREEREKPRNMTMTLKVNVKKSKPDGRDWDTFGQHPDILIKIRVHSTGYTETSQIKEDSYKVNQTFGPLMLKGEDKIDVSIFDEDLGDADSDLIGKTTINYQYEGMNLHGMDKYKAGESNFDADFREQ